MDKEQWTVYIIQAKNGNLYTGITKDLSKRLANHHKGKTGARFFRFSAPEAVVFQEQHYSNRSQAMKRENEIKKMTRKQKNTLIANWNQHRHSDI